MPPTYSLVVPIFNEEAVIPILLRRLDALLDSSTRRARRSSSTTDRTIRARS